MSDTAAKIHELEILASQIKIARKKLQIRRPLVIEFCGSPKAGKSTIVNALNIFLRRNGFKTRVLSERASVCPVPDKFDPFFNIWTACSALAELIEYTTQKPREIDVIISDRGIFDALCWFEWQHERKHLDSDDYTALVSFLTMKKWRAIIDLICVFVATPEKSLEREYANLLTRKRGSVMNPVILGEYKAMLEKVASKYREEFRFIENTDTSEMEPNEVSFRATKSILLALREITIEKIGYFGSAAKSQLPQGNTFMWSDGGVSTSDLEFGLRPDVEIDLNALQPIPIVCFTNRERSKILLVKKRRESIEHKNSPEMDRFLIYAGGHVRFEDKLGGESEPLLLILKQTLSREIHEELGVSYHISEQDPICIWHKEHDTSRRHLAVCFVAEVDFDTFTFDPLDSEFTRRTGKSESGSVIAICEMKNYWTRLDSWSQQILRSVFEVVGKVDLPEQSVLQIG